MNQQAKLSSRPTMSFFVVWMALAICELAAKVETHHSVLYEAQITEALDYAVAAKAKAVDGSYRSFQHMGSFAICAPAIGTLVSLLGRNEKGKTISQEAIGAVVHDVQLTPLKLIFPASQIQTETSRVANVLVSDTHKRLMLVYSSQLIAYLMQCLLINDDTPWRGTDGADALQEASALAFHQLALFAPWAEVLKSTDAVIPALRELLEVGSKGAQESAAAALFELDGHSRPEAIGHASERSTNFDGSDQQELAQSHIMVPYSEECFS